MGNSRRNLLGIVLIIAIVAAVIIGDTLRRNSDTVQNDSSAQSQNSNGGGNGAGNGNQDNSSSVAVTIPVYVNSELAGNIAVDQLETLEETSFVDAQEGQTQRGWLLLDIIPAVVDVSQFTDAATITVQSTSRDKSAQLTWQQITTPENNVLFDVSGRGTLKLVSERIETLDTRDEWVQDVDRIDITLEN